MKSIDLDQNLFGAPCLADCSYRKPLKAKGLRIAGLGPERAFRNGSFGGYPRFIRIFSLLVDDKTGDKIPLSPEILVQKLGDIFRVETGHTLTVERLMLAKTDGYKAQSAGKQAGGRGRESGQDMHNFSRSIGTAGRVSGKSIAIDTKAVTFRR